MNIWQMGMASWILNYLEWIPMALAIQKSDKNCEQI